MPIASRHARLGAQPLNEGLRRVASIDIGSNTTRILVSDVTPQGLVHVVDEESVTLQLGRLLASEGRFNDVLLARVTEVLEDFDLLARAANAESIEVVATAAVRASANGRELIEAARRRLGIQVRVIEGLEEARLAFHGALFTLPITDGLLIDIGGGSTEVVEFRDRELVAEWSLPLGALQVADQFLASDPPSEREVAAARRYIQRTIKSAKLPVLPSSGALVGTGGTVRNLARVDRRRQRYPIGRLHGYPLPVARLRRLLPRMMRMTGKARALTPGLNPDRAQTVLGGGLILDVLARAVGAADIVAAGEGIREGLARRPTGRRLPSIEEVRQAALDGLQADLVQPERDRVEHLTVLALAIHVALDAEGSTIEVLRDAARLIPLGRELDFYNRGSRASEIVLAAGLPGFSHREVARVASVLRLTERDDSSLAGLRELVTPAEEPELRRCAAILILADGILRRTPLDRAHDIELTRTRKGLDVRVPEWPRRPSDDPTARAAAMFDREIVVRARRSP